MAATKKYRKRSKERMRGGEGPQTMGPSRNNRSSVVGARFNAINNTAVGPRLIGSRGQPLWELMILFTPLHPPFLLRYFFPPPTSIYTGFFPFTLSPLTLFSFPLLKYKIQFDYKANLIPRNLFKIFL